MSKAYKIVAAKNDPELTLKLPAEILRDLVLRSSENGHSVEVEVALRLARTLERDQEMMAEDDALALAAFEKIESLLK